MLSQLAVLIAWPLNQSMEGCSIPQGAILYVGAVSLKWPGFLTAFLFFFFFFLEGVVHYGGWIKRLKGELHRKSQSAAKSVGKMMPQSAFAVV